MKKLLLIAFAVISCSNIFSQASFEFSKSDSVNMSKEQIYTKSKMFITDTWKSTKSVLQNDDKDGGVIQLKGRYETNGVFTLSGNYFYYYDYTVRIRVKENKYKIEIYDIFCSDVKCTASSRTGILIQPFDGNGDDVKTSNFSGGISKKKAVEMMVELRAYFNSIVTSYSEYISKSTKVDDF